MLAVVSLHRPFISSKKMKTKIGLGLDKMLLQYYYMKLRDFNQMTAKCE